MRPQHNIRRNLTVLGIETSADDTCVTRMEINDKEGSIIAKAKNVARVTCPNKHHGGIHPVEAAAHHTKHLSGLVTEQMSSKKPDLICVTRGPGMGGCLSVGVTTAKAL